MFSENSLTVEIGKLQKFALYLTRNTYDANRLVQFTCLCALEKTDCYDNDSNLFHWMSDIMHTVFVSRYSYRGRFEVWHNSDPDPEKHHALSEQDTPTGFPDTQRTVEQLDHNYLNIFILACIEGRNDQDASGILGIPVGTVRSRLSRSRAQLQFNMNKPPERESSTDMPTIPAYISSHALRRRR